MVKDNYNPDCSTILAIGAHPDDFEIGAGMRLMYHTENGNRVIGIIGSDGEKGGDRKVRLEEAKYAAELIGIDKLHMLHFDDTKFPDLVTIKDYIEEVVDKEEPSTVYIHFEGDRHQDHKKVSEASAIACRKVPNILRYKSPSTIINEFHPHVFHMGSEEDFLKKKELLEVYDSQKNRDGIFDIRQVEIDSLFYAQHLQAPGYYAEAFCANHIILNKLVGHND